MKVGDTTFKVHLDGYNLLPLLTGQTKESPRKEFYYLDDDSSACVTTTGSSCSRNSGLRER